MTGLNQQAPTEVSAAPVPTGSGLTARLDRFQRRRPAAGFPLAVLYKYFDDSGGYLAALITYYGFVSLFPLLLLLSTILGFALSGNPHLQQQVFHSALGQFPVVSKDLDDPSHLGGATTGLVIGILGSLYGGLGVAQAIQYTMNVAWAVPRNSRPNPFKARGRSLLLLGTAGLAVVGTTVLSALGSSNVGSLGTIVKVLVLIASVLVNAAVFVLAFQIATALDLTVRQVLPGAVAAAVIWQLLQSFGVVYVGHVVNGSTTTNGVFKVVLGLLAFLYLSSVALVFCVELNVVRVKKLAPRSLLTPFTDNVQLTGGDRRAYTGLAVAQRSKGFEDVVVSFDQPPEKIGPSAKSAAPSEND